MAVIHLDLEGLRAEVELEQTIATLRRPNRSIGETIEPSTLHNAKTDDPSAPSNAPKQRRSS